LSEPQQRVQRVVPDRLRLVLTPLIHRTHNGCLTFASGYPTAMFALVTCIVVLLADPPGSRLPGVFRIVLSLGALGLACTVALGLVVDQAHCCTDTIGAGPAAAEPAGPPKPS
jgi:hypothetical protein